MPHIVVWYPKKGCPWVDRAGCKILPYPTAFYSPYCTLLKKGEGGNCTQKNTHCVLAEIFGKPLRVCNCFKKERKRTCTHMSQCWSVCVPPRAAQQWRPVHRSHDSEPNTGLSGLCSHVQRVTTKASDLLTVTWAMNETSLLTDQQGTLEGPHRWNSDSKTVEYRFFSLY